MEKGNIKPLGFAELTSMSGNRLEFPTPQMPLKIIKNKITTINDEGLTPQERERATINSLIIESRDSFQQSLNNICCRTNFPKKTWNKLEGRREKLYSARQNLSREILKLNPQDKVTARSMCLMFRTIESLLMLESLEKQRKIAKGYGLEHNYNPLSEILDFDLCSELQVKIDGLSILDIISSNNITPDQYLKTVVNATLAGEASSYAKISSENEVNPMIEKYPNRAHTAIVNACDTLTIISILDHELTKDIQMPNFPTNTEEEIIIKTQSVINKIAKKKELLFKSVFSPEDQRFPLIKEIMQDYLDMEDSLAKGVMLLKFGCNDLSTVISTYNNAKAFARNGCHPEQKKFYESLAENTKEFTRNFDYEYHIFTLEEPPKYFDLADSNDLVVPSFEDITQTNMEIQKKSNVIRYYVDPALFKFCSPKILEGITVEFLSADNPNNVTITLRGIASEADRSDFTFHLDAKEEFIIWQFLEYSDDPDMQSFRDACLVGAKEILLYVQKQAEESQEYLVREEPVVTTPNIIRQKRKYEKPKVQKPLIITQDASVQEAQQKKKKKKTSYIDISNKEALYKIMEDEGICKTDQQRIIDAIEDFNERGAGIFKKLTSNIKHDDKRVRELKVGQFRVLTTPATLDQKNGNSEEHIVFDPYGIKHSKKLESNKRKNYM